MQLTVFISEAEATRLNCKLPIELHRADARLREAESIRIPCFREAVHFAQMCRDLEDIPPFEMFARESQNKTPDPGWIQRRKCLKERFLGKEPAWHERVGAELRRAESLVTDAIRFLNRAEPVLRDRRRNVWWTTWFFERRLRAIALSVWASVFQTGTPIPFLGLEAAMRKTATVADLLLEDAIRMIRSDAYRLASIIDAYASCAKALQIRLMLDETCFPLTDRQARMQERLSKAVQELERVFNRRTDLAKSQGGKLHSEALSYVKAIQKRSATLAEHLKERIDSFNPDRSI